MHDTSGSFHDAVTDFRYLRERGFPEKAALKMVGDRYRLTRLGRNCLFRGVILRAKAQARMAKLVTAERVEGASLGMDWYNVLITVESHLRGTPLFIAEDGLVRDSAAAHGSYRGDHLTARAVGEIVSALAALRPRRVDVFLDSPIAHSGLMAEDLRGRLAAVPGLLHEVSLAHTADYPLKSYAGIVATSDSVILDAAPGIFDLARHVLETAFRVTPPSLEEVARPAPGGPWRLLESGNPAP
jgi:hypothetical protein